MPRVYPGHYEWRTFTQAEFAALGAGGFRPGRVFRIAVTGADLAADQGLVIESARGGNTLYLPGLPQGQIQVAGEAAICAAILDQDAETPPNRTNLGTATIEIGYAEADFD